MEEARFHTRISKSNWGQLKADDRSGPIQMLNLVRLRDKADYTDGHAATGAVAYQRYSDISAPVFGRLGGKIIWHGGHEPTLVGPPDEVWDIAFIAEYPSVQSFMQMMKDPHYREAMSHRQAAVMDSRLIRFGAHASCHSFAG